MRSSAPFPRVTEREEGENRGNNVRLARGGGGAVTWEHRVAGT